MDMVAKAKFERQEAFEQREAAQRITNHLQVMHAKHLCCLLFFRTPPSQFFFLSGPAGSIEPFQNFFDPTSIRLLMQGINDRHVAAVKALSVAQAGQKALQEQAKSRQEAFENLQDELVRAMQEASKTKQELAAANLQIPSLRLEIKSLSAKVAGLLSDAERLQSAHDNTQQLLGSCTMELEASQEEAKQLVTRLEVAKHSYEKLQASSVRLQDELQEKVGLLPAQCSICVEGVTCKGHQHLTQQQGCGSEM